MDVVTIAGVETSRFILGSNPFSGFSHQGKDRDLAMKCWYTVARIKETLFEAERLGITSIIARTDFHVIRMLLEYRDEGGKLQWFAQTCPGVGPTEMCVKRAASMNAKACHIHGGVTDNWLAQGQMDQVQPAVDMIRELGMLAGIAGHNVRVFQWAEEHLDINMTTLLPRAEWVLRAEVMEEWDVAQIAAITDPWMAYLNADMLADPLVLRPRRRGERFRPQGMGGHSVKLSALMVNLKIPRAWRDRVPLLAAGDEVMWMCGRRIGERATVGPESRQVARLWFERAEREV